MINTLFSFGGEPTVIRKVELQPSEMCFVQYLPIKMPDTFEFILPPNLHWTAPLFEDFSCRLEDYVYLTVKHMWVAPNYKGNRHGWHTDGFGTDDINYIWYDAMPTEFCVQDFWLTNDCDLSILQMQQQAKEENIKTYPVNTLLKLDQRIVHRVSESSEAGFRTFVKISVSKDKYNLKGNAHNYHIDYEWDMVDRAESRNHPSKTY